MFSFKNNAFENVVCEIGPFCLPLIVLSMTTTFIHYEDTVSYV